MTHVQLSVEEYLHRCSFNESGIVESPALNPTLIDQSVGSFTNNTCSPCDEIYLLHPQNCGIKKNDFDVYLSMSGNSKGQVIDTSDHLALNNDLLNPFKQIIHENAQIPSKSDYILLSRSVGVTMPKKLEDPSHHIEIVRDLEPNYKPRYKSDYFSQDGTIRKPRYVADQLGNHYVSIKVAPGSRGYIRVDWVTIPNEQNIRLSMPYKFQQDNDSLKVPDVNPFYSPVNADISGLTKHYLVLIKSKQDELKAIQSLLVFPPVHEILQENNFKQRSPLMPKQFIQKYQLDKSQLAFTYYALSADGKSYVADWNTTVYSTVLTETPVDSSKKRKINCPECLCSFEITIDGINDIGGDEKVIKKRKQ